ncbi:hypothetical protein EWM64_g7297 [Hericium alpestre]|uniref:Uncharacterized protein n=1 Tax=Hericium alpestre TaxID=135208 RepID=A0A4Y9ZPA1_9AGAM|nr:hypothetical protein EWM64_g7297 [Hericium alpestre]
MDLLKDDLDAIEQAVDTKMAIADLVKPATNDSKPNKGMHHLPEDTTTHGLLDDMTPFIDRMQGAATRIKGLQTRVLEVGRKLQEVDDQGQSLIQPADGNGASGAQA